MSVQLNILVSYRRNLVSLLSVPIILICFIYIQYGAIIDTFLITKSEFIDIFHLQTQMKIFTSDIQLPGTVKQIGYTSSLFIYILFGGWLISCLLSSYKSLSERKASMYGIFIEMLLILLTYVFIASPGLKLWITLTGYVIISSGFILLFLYLLYSIRNKK